MSLHSLKVGVFHVPFWFLCAIAAIGGVLRAACHFSGEGNKARKVRHRAMYVELLQHRELLQTPGVESFLENDLGMDSFLSSKGFLALCC